MSIMAPYAINVLPRPCCDRPRPFLNCGQWSEIGTPIQYGVCQTCGAIVAACQCGCNGEGTLIPSAVLGLARRWPEQYAEITAMQKRCRKSATTVTVPVPKLVTFRLRDQRQEPERRQDATFAVGRRSGSCLLTLVSRLLHRVATLMFTRGEPRRIRTTMRADAAPGGRHEF